MTADWRRVCAAAGRGIALEIDAYPGRQDLDVELLGIAREEGCLISIGADAHSLAELEFLDVEIAAATLAEIPAERIITTWRMERLREWRDRRREEATTATGS